MSYVFPSVKFVEQTVLKLVPILFQNYDGGDVTNFSYIGGDQGRAQLESALAQSQVAFAGVYLNESIADKAAALTWSIIKNHPFVDGNKRAALTTMNLFLLMNGHALLETQDKAMEMCRRIAGYSEPVQKKDVADWLTQRVINREQPNWSDKQEEFLDRVNRQDLYIYSAYGWSYETQQDLSLMIRSFRDHQTFNEATLVPQ